MNKQVLKATQEYFKRVEDELDATMALVKDEATREQLKSCISQVIDVQLQLDGFLKDHVTESE